jgi:lipopolysaccharide export system ATP-binding protein
MIEEEQQPDPEQCILQASGLHKSYGGKPVVRGVSIHVQRGEIVGLLGPNGAGKTTSFYMIVGLVKPTAGQIFFAGRDVSSEPMHRRARMGMGYLAQEPSIFRKLTVEENMLAIAETIDVNRRERKEIVAALLDELGLGALRRNRAFTLSGGERRRLEIARALITQPSFLMLDEPFSGVDPKAVNDVQDIIRALQSRGLGILVTDHNVRETLSVCHRAYLICEGRVEREGTSDFLSNDPVSRDLYLGPRFSM